MTFSASGCEYDTNSGNRFVCWYVFGVAGCASPILYSTVNSIVKNDSEERAVILVRVTFLPQKRCQKLIEVRFQGSMMTFGYRCVDSTSTSPLSSEAGPN